MSIDLILSFIGASVVLSLMPGPDNLFVLTESITKGRNNGIGISIGLSLGVLVHTMAVATGLSIIIQKSELAFTAIKYLGAIYLFYLAFMAFKEKRPVIDLETNVNPHKASRSSLIKKGFLMNVLNPKVALFFIAFFPEFISPDGYNVRLQMIILGLIFMLQAVLIFSMIAVLSGKLTKFVNNPKFWTITKWCKISVLTLLGLVLVFAEK